MVGVLKRCRYFLKDLLESIVQHSPVIFNLNLSQQPKAGHLLLQLLIVPES